MYKHHQGYSSVKQYQRIEYYEYNIRKALQNDEKSQLEEAIKRSELDYIPDCDSGIEDNPYLRIPELPDLEYIMSPEFKNYVVQKNIKNSIELSNINSELISISELKKSNIFFTNLSDDERKHITERYELLCMQKRLLEL